MRLRRCGRCPLLAQSIPSRAEHGVSQLRSETGHRLNTGRAGGLRPSSPCDSRWDAPTANLFLLGCKSSANHLPWVRYLSSLNLPNISLSFFFHSPLHLRGEDNDKQLPLMPAFLGTLAPILNFFTEPITRLWSAHPYGTRITVFHLVHNRSPMALCWQAQNCWGSDKRRVDALCRTGFLSAPGIGIDNLQKD